MSGEVRDRFNHRSQATARYGYSPCHVAKLPASKPAKLPKYRAPGSRSLPADNSTLADLGPHPAWLAEHSSSLRRQDVSKRGHRSGVRTSQRLGRWPLNDWRRSALRSGRSSRDGQRRDPSVTG